MDAKAKVVAWEVVRYDRHDKESREVVLSPLTDDTVLDDGDEAFALMRVADHEAALAELRSWKLEVVSRLGMDDWSADSTTPTDVYRHVQWLEERSKASLRSDLEALAGRMYADADDKDRHYEWKCCCDLYGGLLMTLHASTLASSATGEKNTEEGS